jgi:membrane protein YdbS with pleckstrin-like domain
MSEHREEIQTSGMESKFTKVALTLIAMLLIFVGPTYIPYLMYDVLRIEYFVSIGVGVVLFILGLVMLVYLIRKKVIT